MSGRTLRMTRDFYGRRAHLLLIVCCLAHVALAQENQKFEEICVVTGGNVEYCTDMSNT